MSRVFIVQNTLRVTSSGKMEPKFDFSQAASFGELVHLLDHNASPFDLPPVQRRLDTALLGFTNNDYLLLVGNPVLIGLAVAVAAAHNNGQVGMLQWSGARRCYIPARAFNVLPCS